MLEISSRVWSEWRGQSEEFGHSGSLRLQLVSPAGTDVAARALDASLAEVRTVFDGLPPRPELEGNPPWFGQWDWVRGHDRVVFSAMEFDDFELAMSELVDGLVRRGVTGGIDVWDGALGRPEIEGDGVINAHIRVRGERASASQGDYRWRPEPAAYAAVVASVWDWCLRLDPAAEYSLSCGQVRGVPLAADDDLVARVFEATQRSIPAHVGAIAHGGIRSFSAHENGRVLLRAAGSLMSGAGWREQAEAFIAILRSAADAVAYAHVGHRVALPFHEPGTGFEGWDWPQRPLDTRALIDSEGFEDLYVPDAYPYQLLGPGYVGRVPPVTTWQTTRLGDRSTLLEARYPQSWLETPFAPDGPLPPWQPPELLARARRELAPILFSEEVPDRASFTD